MLMMKACILISLFAILGTQARTLHKEPNESGRLLVKNPCSYIGRSPYPPPPPPVSPYSPAPMAKYSCFLGRKCNNWLSLGTNFGGLWPFPPLQSVINMFSNNYGGPKVLPPPAPKPNVPVSPKACASGHSYGRPRPPPPPPPQVAPPDHPIRTSTVVSSFLPPKLSIASN